jgi:hypothetical protein
MQMKLCLWGVAAGLILSFLLLGSIHFVHGSDLPIPKIILKDRFGLKETFVDLDLIAGRSWDEVTRTYPRAYQTLIRKHIIWLEGQGP